MLAPRSQFPLLSPITLGVSPTTFEWTVTVCAKLFPALGSRDSIAQQAIVFSVQQPSDRRLDFGKIRNEVNKFIVCELPRGSVIGPRTAEEANSLNRCSNFRKRLAGGFVREKTSYMRLFSISHVNILWLISSPKSRKLERLGKLS